MHNEKKIALVTGGSRGIGKACVQRLVQEEYHVVFSYLQRQDEAEKLVLTLQEIGGNVAAVSADVSDEAAVKRLFAELDQHGPLKVLVNNAGIIAPQQRFADMKADRVLRLFSVNVFGAMYCAREAIRRMSTAQGGGGGAIVNVSSIASLTGSPNEYIDYASSKGALDSFTRGLAKEVAEEGIRVNAVRPGFIETQMHADAGEPDRVLRLAPSLPMKRGGTPEEVANAIVWLLSDEASYVTGSFIDLAGGR